MKRLITAMLVATLLACNGGKHDPVVHMRDSTDGDSNYQPGRPYYDKVDTIYNSDSVRPDSGARY